MKKILFVLMIVAALFTVVSCGDAMHDGTQMVVSKIELTGLPDFFDGVVLTYGFNFTAGGLPAAWADHPLVVTVAADGKATVTGPWTTSEPELKGLFVPRPTVGGTVDWNNRIADSIQADTGDIKMANKWTGPVVTWTLRGTPAADKKMTWEFVAD